MLTANNWYCVTCQSCCCQMCHVDHLNKPAKPLEHTANSTSLQCQCNLTDSTHDAAHLSQVVTLPCSQSQDVLSVMHTGDLHCASVSSPGIRRVQCTCRAESQSVSIAHCTACICYHHGGSKPGDLIRVVRCDESGNKAAADYCTCVGKFSHERGTSSCQHGVTLSDVSSRVPPLCTKFTQVNRPQPTSMHSGLYGVEQKRERSSNSCRCGSSGGVTIVDVSEWQRRHIEELDRQKLEVSELYIATKFLL